MPPHTNIHPLRLSVVSTGLTIMGLVLASMFISLPGASVRTFQISGVVAGISCLAVAVVIRNIRTVLTSYVALLVVVIVPLINVIRYQIDPPPESDALTQDDYIDDPRLIFRIKPNVKGHDANGFRNVSVPNSVDIIAIGDSQTWGINARVDTGWPGCLHTLTGQTVYNLGVGGYGPVEYWVLLGDAIEQYAPKRVVVGFYFGNDLYDAFESIYLHDGFPEFRLPEADDEWFSPIIAGQLEAVVWWNNEGHWVAYDAGNVSTKFTPEYRLYAVNLDSPIIAEGLRLTQVVFVKMAEIAQASGVQLVIALIPTKEMVYAELIAPDERSDLFARQIALERRVYETLVAWCEEHGIACLDVRPAMTDNVKQGVAMYDSTPDGHPIPAGYRVIAEVIATVLRDDE